MKAFRDLLTLTALAATALETAAVIFSVRYPARRIWPPKADSKYGIPFMFALFIINGLSLIVLGIADWNLGGFPAWLRIAAFLPWLGGCSLAAWSATVLGMDNTLGARDRLIIRGPYRWIRNPQYLGFMLALLGWGFTSGSWQTLIAGSAACIPLATVPLAEEPWLLDRYGQEYESYFQNTPRFLPFPTARQAG